MKSEPLWPNRWAPFKVLKIEYTGETEAQITFPTKNTRVITKLLQLSKTWNKSEIGSFLRNFYFSQSSKTKRRGGTLTADWVAAGKLSGCKSETRWKSSRLSLQMFRKVICAFMWSQLMQLLHMFPAQSGHNRFFFLSSNRRSKS